MHGLQKSTKHADVKDSNKLLQRSKGLEKSAEDTRGTLTLGLQSSTSSPGPHMWWLQEVGEKSFQYMCTSSPRSLATQSFPSSYFLSRHPLFFSEELLHDLDFTDVCNCCACLGTTRDCIIWKTQNKIVHEGSSSSIPSTTFKNGSKK